ncbi:hypothetical protein [Sphingomonas montanisoli]|uniref:Uncharacterized protein n=1 Tax=Sphingomonas montanisoli TaxID=2606412 RepID=A0A5D9C8K5_9SPHN|nr:hypothetical protein [Sphingomonas montanisoli]TZG27462.1 hypothetical protein FYJ91_07675 [Sphingomonas montanisoli]
MVIPLEAFAPVAALVGLATVGGWIYTTRLRITNGYPLENSWGKSVYPQRNEETVERVKLLSSENAQLRAELSAIKDRLATVERIVTDGSYRLDREIDALRDAPLN